MVVVGTNPEVERLEDRIKVYSESYYNGEPEISDAAFDLLIEQLRRLDPNNKLLDKVGWGYTVETDVEDTKSHKFEIRKFEGKIREADSLGIRNGEGIITPKLDGGSVCCYYTNGHLDYALTRGDGYSGFDVTSKLKYLAPETLMDSSFTGMVRGEITMREDIFESKYSKDYESNRNLSVGLIRRKYITVEEIKDLSFVAYTVRGISDWEIDNKSSVLEWLKLNNFTVVDIIESPDVWDDKSFRNLILDYRNSKRYPLDGIVVTTERYNKLEDGTWVPAREMAYKTEADSEITTVESIEWNLTRTGKFVPVINIKPVSLSGATVSRATAFNYQWVKSTKLGVGSEVRIQRSGEVIPNIVEVISEGDPQAPIECPNCHCALSQVGTDLVCKNPDCDAKHSYRLFTYLCEVANPKHMGDTARYELAEQMNLLTIDDLYECLDDIPTKMVTTDYMMGLYKDMIEMLRGDVEAKIFFVGCSIPGCGWGGAKNLGRHLDLILEAPINDETKDKIRNLPGVMYKSKDWVADHLEDIRRWASYPHRLISTQEIESHQEIPNEQKVIAVTGRLSVTRSKFFEEMAKYGFIEGPIAKAEYLVTNTPNSNSSKNRAAREKGVTVISEDDFRALLR